MIGRSSGNSVTTRKPKFVIDVRNADDSRGKTLSKSTNANFACKDPGAVSELSAADANRSEEGPAVW